MAADSPLRVRGCYGKDSSPSGFAEIVKAGFTVIDRSAFREKLDELPHGVRALVWLGDYDNKACAWKESDDWIRSHVGAIKGHPAIAAYYVVDEPHVWDCPSAPAQVKARSALVRSIDPGPPTVAVIEPHSPGNPYAPYVGAADIIGADPYPCSHKNGCVMSKIDDAIRLLQEAGVPRYWGVLQAFEDSWYRMPTPDELHDEFRRWRGSRMEGYLVFSWAWKGTTLENHPDVVEGLREENGR